jgi:hypothetical protein
MTRIPLLLLFLSACSSVEHPPLRDSACTEALVDRPAVDPTGADTVWLVDSIEFPDTASAANRLGKNLDCDVQNRPDNAMGQVASTLAGLWGSDLSTEIAGYIADGRLLHLITVRATSTVEADGVGFTVQHGIDLDGDPADNFTGVEPFAVDTERGRGTASGRFADGRLEARGGQLPLGLVMPYLEEPLIIPIEGAAVDAEIIDGKLVGRVGGGIPAEAVDILLMPVFQYAFERIIDRDCTGPSTAGEPPCGCAPGATGQTLLDLFDEEPDRPGTEPDGDCFVGVDEMRGNSLISSLLAPDVDLFDADGNPDPMGDGTKESSSIGVGFTAVPAAIQP